MYMSDSSVRSCVEAEILGVDIPWDSCIEFVVEHYAHGMECFGPADFVGYVLFTYVNYNRRTRILSSKKKV